MMIILMVSWEEIHMFRDRQDYTKQGVISLVLLAFERGKQGNTFATRDESIHPVYDACWRLGAEYRHGRVKEPHCLIGCGCARCRLSRIIQAQSILFSDDSIDAISKQLIR